MHQPSGVTTKPTVHLRAALFQQHAGIRGFNTTAKLAAEMNMHRSTVSRVVSGQHLPSPEFIAGALLAFPGLQFADLFEIHQ